MERRSKGVLTGALALELLQPFLRGSVQSISGDLKVEVKAGGTLAKPELRGQIAIVNAIKVRPTDFPSDVTVGSGVFALDAGEVGGAGVVAIWPRVAGFASVPPASTLRSPLMLCTEPRRNTRGPRRP